MAPKQIIAAIAAYLPTPVALRWPEVTVNQ